MLLFEEAFEAALRVAAVLADHAEGAAFRRFGDQPVKIRRIIRHEPDAGRIRRAVFRQAHDGLNERHGLDRGPAGRARHAARGAVRANHAVRVQLLALAAGFHLEPQAARIRTNTQETRIERKRRTGLLGLAGQRRNQVRALNDEIGLGQRDLRRTAISEKLEAANLVDDAFAGESSHLMAEVVRNNQRPGRRLELRF